MSSGIKVRYSFYGVGQGLFSAGSIEIANSQTQKFNWVYDCGTASSKGLLNAALNDLAKELDIQESEARPYLDMVTISHFDKDHINGLIDLLNHFDVGDLLLPYVPLWQRLVIAFNAHRAHRSRLTSFLVNPVAFIAAVSGANVKRILFASSGSPKREPDSDQQPTTSDDEGPLKVETEDLSSLDAEDEKRLDAERMVSTAGGGTSVVFIKVGTALTVANCWEFVPYNDAELASNVSAAFRRGVEKERGKLMGSVHNQKNEALKDLKKLYNINFGTRPKNKNLISLFLYAGPILIPTLLRASIFNRVTENQITEIPKLVIMNKLLLQEHPEILYEYLELDTKKLSYFPNYWAIIPASQRKGGLLYTGDGYLNTDNRFASMQAFLKARRVKNLAVLQVMHHGAKDNWHAGLAKKISPEFSVFSSNPDHKTYCHPHTEVLQDFGLHRPLQASKNSTVKIEVNLQWS